MLIIMTRNENENERRAYNVMGYDNGLACVWLCVV